MLLLNSAWTDAELDESILKLCVEFPYARMAACSRTLEYCRRTTPRGEPGALLQAMRDAFHVTMSSPNASQQAAA